MDRAASRGPRPGPPGSLLHGSCNYLQNVVAISYIFVLQLPTFLLCSIHYLQNVVAISYIFVLQLPTFLLCSIHYRLPIKLNDNLLCIDYSAL